MRVGCVVAEPRPPPSVQVLTVLRFEGFGDDSALPRWFREIVARRESDWLRMLLVFVTGEKDLPRAPKPEQLTVQAVERPRDSLPTSHTCFNTLDLPCYESEMQLEEKLNIALMQGAGFGFG